VILPAGSVDVHAHVLDPALPATEGAAYELFPAFFENYRDHLDQLGFDNGVLVTASAHGTDNRPLLHALARGNGTLRGVAVVDAEISEHELNTLHEAGVRGIRLQDKFAGGTPLSTLDMLGSRISDLGWHIEIWTNLAANLDWLPRAIGRCPVPIVLDHFGHLPAEISEGHPAVQALIALARDHGTWITLSGAYRLAPQYAPTSASKLLQARVQVLAENIPNRLLWGSDWPYVAPPGETPTVDQLQEELSLWLPDPELRRRVLVTNPRECYNFDSPAPASP
jgi:2-pyrone-4,6-dicarboxylate lactonase